MDDLFIDLKDDKIDRIADCRGAIADKGGDSPEDTKTSRLAELTVFALSGFGTSPTHLGTEVYGSELESTIKRQSLSSKPAIRNDGTRTPSAEQISKGDDVVTWGCAGTSSSGDNMILLGGFPQWSGDNFSIDYRTGDAKGHSRPKETVTINMFDK